MTTSRKLAVTLTGAVALASGAYAMGSQSGAGSAVADPPTPATVVGYGYGPGPGAPPGPGGSGRRERFGLSDLATRLGVSGERLRRPLAALRPARPGRADRRAALAAALAKALGLSQDKVQAALDKLHADRQGGRDD